MLPIMVNVFYHILAGCSLTFSHHLDMDYRLVPENSLQHRLVALNAYACSHINTWIAIIEDWVTAGDVVAENKVSELEKMLNHLQIPLDRRRVSCVEYADLNVFKRTKNKLKHSLYSKGLSRIIWKNIGEVDRLLVRMGHKGIPYHKYERLRCFDNVTVSYGL